MDEDLLKLNYSQKIDIEGMNEKVADVTLDENQSKTCSITGKVTSSGSTSLEGATVKAFDSNGKPYMHTVTDAEGNYALLNMLPDSYSVVVSMPGYKLSDEKGATIAAGGTAKIDFSLTEDLKVSIGAISGIIKNNEGENVEGAQVTIYDSDNNPVAVTTSIDDGEFVFYDITNGEYKVKAVKAGYHASGEYTVLINENNKIANITIIITRNIEVYKGTINGRIVDKNGIAIPNAFVGLYEITLGEEGNIVTEKLILATKTNSIGKYLFGNIDEGNYVVKAKKNQD